MLETKTAEKVYRINDGGRVLKRSLRPDEYQILSNGERFVPSLVVERLTNEAACMTFISENTDIPVPKLLETYERDGCYYLWTEFVDGVEMGTLTDEEQSTIFPQGKRHIPGPFLSLSVRTLTSISSKHCYYFAETSIEVSRRSNRNSLSSKYGLFLSSLGVGTTVLARRRVRLLPWRLITKQYLGGPYDASNCCHH